MIQYPAKVLFQGSFGPSDIVVTPISLPALPHNVVSHVERIWLKETSRNPRLTAWPLLVAASLDNVDSKLLLRSGLSNYKNFMGTTADETVENQYRHLAIGVLAVLTTADGYVMLGVRSPTIDWGLLRHVVPGGRLSPDQGHPYKGIVAEFREELGLTHENVAGLQCIGVASDQTWGRLNVEFIFRASTPYSAFQVMKTASTASSAGEHCHLEPFPWQPKFIRDLLLTDPYAYVPTGWAALALALRNDFGTQEFPEWTPVHRLYEEHVRRHLDMLGLSNLGR